MGSLNKSKKSDRVVSGVMLAGGAGNYAAKQSEEKALRRSVMSCLLWEDNAYIDGESVAKNIGDLIPQVDPQKVANMAVEARFTQKLRHVPLLMCREMLKHPSHKWLVADTLSKVIHRPDELTEFLAIYWKDNGRKTLPAQAKKGLAKAFSKFNEYQLAKYNKKGKEVSLRDVLRLVHAKPQNEGQEILWSKLMADALDTPDTWEVALSGGADKRETWSRLISDNKLGSFAFLKNMRNIVNAGVSPSVIREYLGRMPKEMMLPIDFLKAQKYAPDFTRELEQAMFDTASLWKKLPGRTVMVVDVSGSMNNAMSGKSDFTRLDAAISMAILTGEICESVAIYATAGSDPRLTHKTVKLNPYRGFALADAINNTTYMKPGSLGGGGIFTRQCLDYIKTQEKEKPDRIIVFSDSQDCDRTGTKPQPFGKKNYIVDVSPDQYGINYKGVWSAEISGWSEGFLSYIANAEEVLN